MGREWGGDGEGEVSLRATWGQGGRDRITPKEGFQISKREMEGGVTKTSKGSKREDCAITILSTCVYVYNNCLNVVNPLNQSRLYTDIFPLLTTF
jgi:hypothetical protein